MSSFPGPNTPAAKPTVVLVGGLHKATRQKHLLVILVLAAFLRSGVVYWKFENLSVDTDSYLTIALNLLSGEGFCSVSGHPTAYRPPLYPWFVAVCLLMGGAAGLGAAQVVVGTATCCLAWMYARRVGLSEKSSLLTACLVAVDPLLLLYTSQAMTETLVTFVVTLLLVTAASAPSRRNSLFFGILFGLSVLCRPSLWAFGALAVLAKLTFFKKRPNEQESGTLKARVGLLVLGVLVSTAPWAIRNWIVLGRPILMTTHGGYTLLLANNPAFYDVVVERGAIWGNPNLLEWQRQLNRSLAEGGFARHDEIGRDSAMRKQAIRHIQESPEMFVRSCLTRVFRFWSPAPREGAVSSTKRLVVTGYYLAVFVMCLMGCIHIWRYRSNFALGLVLIVSLTAVHSVFWSNARMRAPVTIVVAAVAAGSVFSEPLESKHTEKSNQAREL